MGGPDLQLPAELGPAANSYTAYILAGFREARPDIDVNSVLTLEGVEAVDKAETVCKPQSDEELSGMTPTRFFSAPLASLAGVTEALDDYMGTPVTGYDRPIFLGAGLLDRDVPAKSSLVLYDQLQAHNQDVVLKIYPNDDHSGTVLASLPDTTPFLAALFENGTLLPSHSRCRPADHRSRSAHPALPGIVQSFGWGIGSLVGKNSTTATRAFTQALAILWGSPASSSSRSTLPTSVRP